MRHRPDARLRRPPGASRTQALPSPAQARTGPTRHVRLPPSNIESWTPAPTSSTPSTPSSTLVPSMRNGTTLPSRHHQRRLPTPHAGAPTAPAPFRPLSRHRRRGPPSHHLLFIGIKLLRSLLVRIRLHAHTRLADSGIGTKGAAESPHPPWRAPRPARLGEPARLTWHRLGGTPSEEECVCVCCVKRHVPKSVGWTFRIMLSHSSRSMRCELGKWWQQDACPGGAG